jgi:hypothetical protein
VIAAAAATVLSDLFGSHYTFVDHTYENTFGAKSYGSFAEMAYQSGWSRVLAGVHYKPSVMIGLAQGIKVGNLINDIPLKK